MPHIIPASAKWVTIFDIDGTLANISHRLHWIQTSPKRHDIFLSDSQISKDRPIAEVITVLHALAAQKHHIVLASGRPERTRLVTEKWLTKNLISANALYLRKDGDRRPDWQVKQEILWKMLFDGLVPFMVFDDRQSVVDMWRRNHIKVAQVAPGNF